VKLRKLQKLWGQRLPPAVRSKRCHPLRRLQDRDWEDSLPEWWLGLEQGNPIPWKEQR
jgi:hypothetical protein